MEKELKHAFYINLNWTREDMRAEELCDSILQPDPLFVTDDQCHSSSLCDPLEENSGMSTRIRLYIYLTGWIDYILSTLDTHLIFSCIRNAIGSYVPMIFNREYSMVQQLLIIGCSQRLREGAKVLRAILNIVDVRSIIFFFIFSIQNFMAPFRSLYFENDHVDAAGGNGQEHSQQLQLQVR